MITGCQLRPGGVNHNLTESCSLTRSGPSYCLPKKNSHNRRVSNKRGLHRLLRKGEKKEFGNFTEKF